MSKVNLFYPSVSSKPIAYRGPSTSQDILDFIQEVVADLRALSQEWNDKVVPLLNTLPSGGETVLREERVDAVNPFTNGLDGSQIYTDLTSKASDANNDFLFDPTLKRPTSIKEALAAINAKFALSVSQLDNRLSEVSGTGLTGYATKAELQALEDQVEDLEGTTALFGQIPFFWPNYWGDQIAGFVPVYNHTVVASEIIWPESYPGIAVVRFPADQPNGIVNHGNGIFCPLQANGLMVPANFVRVLPSSDGEWTVKPPAATAALSLGTPTGLDDYEDHDILIFFDSEPSAEEKSTYESLATGWPTRYPTIYLQALSRDDIGVFYNNIVNYANYRCRIGSDIFSMTYAAFAEMVGLEPQATFEGYTAFLAATAVATAVAAGGNPEEVVSTQMDYVVDDVSQGSITLLG
jgi:hypothetical protein